MKQAKKYLIISFLMLIAVLSPISATAAGKTKLSKTKVTLTTGKSTKLVVKNNKKKVKWSSSNKKVATVNGKGKVTAKKQGTAKITAKVGAKKYTCKVTVKKAAKKASTKPTNTTSTTETKQDPCEIYGHDWQTVETINDATCVNPYNTLKQKCTRCGATQSVKSTKKVAGTHVNFVTNGKYVAPSPTNKYGTYYDICHDCGYERYNHKDYDDGWLPTSEGELKAELLKIKQEFPDGTYYGVCGQWLNYVINRIWKPYGTKVITHQDFRKVKVGDAVYAQKDGNGHGGVVTDVIRDANGNATQFSITQSNTSGSKLVNWGGGATVDQTTGKIDKGFKWDYIDSPWGNRFTTVM